VITRPLTAGVVVVVVVVVVFVVVPAGVVLDVAVTLEAAAPRPGPKPNPLAILPPLPPPFAWLFPRCKCLAKISVNGSPCPGTPLIVLPLLLLDRVEGVRFEFNVEVVRVRPPSPCPCCWGCEEDGPGRREEKKKETGLPPRWAVSGPDVVVEAGEGGKPIRIRGYGMQYRILCEVASRLRRVGDVRICMCAINEID
jgi:hypothetical protein